MNPSWLIYYVYVFKEYEMLSKSSNTSPTTKIHRNNKALQPTGHILDLHIKDHYKYLGLQKKYIYRSPPWVERFFYFFG
jgi:hypothetical protein